MGGGAYWTRGNCNPVRDPKRFGVGIYDPAIQFQVKNDDPEIQPVSQLTQVAAYETRSYCIRKCIGVSIVTGGTTTCLVQISTDPSTGVWDTLTTLTDTDSYAISDPYDWIRFSLTNSTNANVWLNKKVATY